MRTCTVLLVGVVSVFLSSCTLFRKPANKSATTTVTSTTTSKPSADSGGNTTLKKPKPYKEIITSKAKTDKGLFTVHQIDQRYFWEIPNSLLGKDILVVNRIAKGATDIRPGGMLGYAGDQIGEVVIQFEKGPDYKLFIKTISYNERSNDSSENGMYRTVRNSNLNPIYASFDIKAFAADSAGSVVEVTDFLSSDNGLLYFDGPGKSTFTLGGYQKDKSYIESMEAFPINVELRAVNTYSKGNQTATYELNTSFVELPQQPMQPRYYDERVGYFKQTYIDFDKPQGVERTSMITRWRLEPKDEDKEKYLRGELVEPKKPIVYYIDPTTPKKWVPYLIQGINDWQQAFEKAGFKNAIYALEAPTDDSTFSLFDARHSAIIYKPSPVPNASGPNVHDPRTGEILESHINWYHNVMQLIHDWYMVQASPNDPKARKMVFDDSLMGQLIRFVSSHEVGHTLGLMHNFGSSSTVPVDSLRSKNYIEKNGFCPSIMDYARFNYVAQPEDGMEQKDLFPRINVYDEWAIDWGYRWLPQLKTREEEKAYMNQWIINSLKKDDRLWYGPQQPFIVKDPRCQSEDLGDNATKASYYGIQNLKRVISNLKEWTREPNQNYLSLENMNKQVIDQYYRYVGHVLCNIVLTKWTPKTVEQPGGQVSFTPKQKQQEAVQFLQQQVFETPHWLMNKDIFAVTAGLGPFLPRQVQSDVIYYLLSFYHYGLMIFAQTEYGEGAYTFDELLSDLEAGIWKELKVKAPIDFHRRALQKMYANRLIQLTSATTRAIYSNTDPNAETRSDFLPIINRHIKNVINAINKALPGYKDEKSKEHLLAVRDWLKMSLDPTGKISSSTTNPSSSKLPESLAGYNYYAPIHENENGKPYQGCWEDGSDLFINNLWK